MSFPSKEQKKVITHRGRPLVVVAAPGTGKTRTLVTRTVKLLEEEPNRDVSFITFTRTSRRDTDRKVRGQVGQDAFDEANFEFPRVCTLHTYAKSIVHKYADKIGRDSSFSILIEGRGEFALVLSELAEDLAIKVPPNGLRADILCYRSTGAWPTDCVLPKAKRHKVLQHFDALLKFYDTFDMEGVVRSACEILSDGHALLPPVFLQVDEYQDLNPMDQRLVHLASSSKSSQVVVVGDDAQSIYGFRHANPSGIRDLWNSSSWERVRFPACHRLPPHILRAAQALISEEDYLGGEVVIPDDDGKRIVTLECTKSDIQIDALAYLINRIRDKGTKKNGDALSWKDFMVLCPTSAFVKKVATTLPGEFEIPSKQRERGSIPDDHWRLLLVLRMLESEDNLALRQWLQIIGLEQKEISRIRKEAMDTGQSLFEYCSHMAIPKVKAVFLHLSKLREASDSLSQFRRVLKRVPYLMIEDSLFPEVGITIDEVTQQPRSVSSIIRTIHEKYGLLDPEVDIPDDDKVLVTTMYSAKGLEADYVLVLWLNDTFMPGPNRDPEEERRVLYVAMTRAKQDVVFLFHERFERGRLLKAQAMSPFLKEITAHLKIKRIKKGDLRIIQNAP